MKNWILAAIFLVTWNEYGLRQINEHKLCDGKDCWDNPAYNEEPLYSVETTTHTMKLATQKDVDLFLGRDQSERLSYENFISFHKEGIISKNAFNIQVSTVEK